MRAYVSLSLSLCSSTPAGIHYGLESQRKEIVDIFLISRARITIRKGKLYMTLRSCPHLWQTPMRILSASCSGPQVSGENNVKHKHISQAFTGQRTCHCLGSDAADSWLSLKVCGSQIFSDLWGDFVLLQLWRRCSPKHSTFQGAPSFWTNSPAPKTRS